jgi:FkbM family methyltransferase
MKLFQWLAEKTILNWKHPFYSRNFFILCSRYLDIWYGDNNFDRRTNGEFWLLEQLMPQSKIVFDVGANIGDYSGEILKINPAIVIYAFEPDPDSYEKLKHLSLVANNIGLGEKEETKALYRASKSTHNSFYQFEAGAASLFVKVSTIDNYCQKRGIRHIDFLKIDVEGHEFFVLKGAEKLLKQQGIDYIQFEFSGATIESRVFLKDFIELFGKYGYDLYRIRAQDVQKVEYAPDKERFTLTNYLAIKKGMRVPV